MRKHLLLFLFLSAFAFVNVAKAGTKLPTYDGGKGTKARPFVIASEEHLKALAQTPEHWTSDFYFVQDGDITLPSQADNEKTNFSPIGNGGVFSAHYDGDGFSISGLSIQAPIDPFNNESYGNFYTISDYESFGLFTNTYQAEITNVTLTNVKILLDTNADENQFIGGLVGCDAGKSSFKNCRVEGEISGKTNVGGLIGASCPAYNTGDLKSTIEDCSVKLNALNGVEKVGGLVGYAKKLTVLRSSVFGGLLSTAAISGNTKVGGFIGEAQSTIVTDCYSKNTIDVVSLATASYVGGFIGELYGGIVTNCYTTGKTVTELREADSNFGGFLGNTDEESKSQLVSCFYDASKTEKTDCNGGVGITTAEMKDPGTFVYNNWDFNATWKVGDDQLPTLDKSGEALPYLWVGSNNNLLSTSWTEANAWYGKAVPDSDADVYIPSSAYSAGYCAIDLALVECNSIVIAKEGKLTIEADGAVTGQLLVKTTAKGEATYNLFIKQANATEQNGQDKTTGWHFVTSPVAGQSIQAFVTNEENMLPSNDLGLYSFGMIDQENQTISYADGAVDYGTMLPGIGYEIKRKEAGYVTFKGEIVTEDVTINSYAPADKGQWAYMGNPYTTSLKGMALLYSLDAKLEASNHAIYTYDEDVLEYIPMNRLTGVEDLAPCQAWMACVKEGGASMTITPNWRILSENTEFKSAKESASDFLQLVASSANGKSNCSVYFDSEASNGLDTGSDAAAFVDSNVNKVTLATKLVDATTSTADFKIQAINSVDIYNASIPLSINTVKAGEVSLSLAGVQLPSDVKLYIEDKLNNVETEITTAQAFTFQASTDASLDADRFVLHTKAATGSSLLEDQDAIKVIAQPANGTLLVKGEIEAGSTLKLYSVTGQVVFSETLTSASEAYVNVTTPLHPGIYIVAMESKAGVFTQKIKW